jgi:Flp pilus assembly protein CpaB
MKSKPLLAAAVAAGLLAVVLVNLYLRRREAALGTTTLLMKAVRDLPAGAPAREADFAPVPYPEKHIDAFRDPKSKEGSLAIRKETFDQHVKDRPLRRDIGAGAFLLRTHFDPPLGPRLNASIPDGKVAVTLPLDRATRSAELITPGDQVDVYTVASGGARGTADAAELLLKGVTVLAVGNQALSSDAFTLPRERAEASTVTLAVTSEQVPKLAPVAVGRALLILALRPPERSTGK